MNREQFKQKIKNRLSKTSAPGGDFSQREELIISIALNIWKEEERGKIERTETTSRASTRYSKGK